MTYYKATDVDGFDFHSHTIDYAGALASGDEVRIKPQYEGWVAKCCSPSVLHASVAATDTLIGGRWPCRLFVVEGEEVAREGNKRGFRSLRVVKECDAGLALGPQASEIIAVIARATKLTSVEASALSRARDAARGAARDAAGGAAWDAAWDAARDAARGAAWDAAGGAAWGAARDAARDAAEACSALATRDLIGTGGYTQRHYDLLTRAWREAIGPIHADDADISTVDFS